MYFSDLCITPHWLSLSLPKVRNFAHFFSTFKYPVCHEINVEIIYIFIGCMSASTDKLRPRSLRSGLSALGSGGRHFEEGSHLCFAYLKNIYIYIYYNYIY